MKSSVPHMPDKHTKAMMRSAPWRIALAASVPTLVAIALVAWSGRRWLDVALYELPAAHASALRDITVASLGLAAIVVLSLLGVAAAVARRAVDPVTRLAVTAERVAAGDLTVAFDSEAGSEQVNRLHRALDDMIGALRRLVHAMRSASDDTATMSAQITAGTEQMSASATEFA